MLRRIAQRTAWAIVTVWAVVTLTFLIYNALPEDPAQVIAGPQARPADVEQIRTQLGLDQPLLTRYGRYMSRLVQFRPAEGEGDTSFALVGPIRIDLGVSYLKNRPVHELLGKALPPTLLLGALAIFVQVAVGAIGGVVAANRRHTVFDWGTVALTLVGISAPTFLTGLALQHFLARQTRWFPIDGYGETFADHVHSAILPALTLGLFGAAYYTRLVRDEMIVLMKQDYVRTARAKGQTDFQVLFRHALRNALMPLVTVIGLNMGILVGGAIVTEKIFRWPGVGSLSVDAIQEHDGPVIMGVVILFSTVVVLSNLLVDLSYALLDPRARS